MIGALLLPSMYLVDLILSRRPDHIIFVLDSIFPPFSFILWIVQWVPFLIGGWFLAILSTILFFCIAGYLIGLLIGSIIEFAMTRHNRKS